MSLTRSRSTSRSRIVKTSNLFPSGESLDPVALLSEILPFFKTLDVPLAVRLNDDSSSVTFLLSTFISKEYEVIGDYVKLGFVRLKIKELKANISYDIEITNDQEGGDHNS